MSRPSTGFAHERGGRGKTNTWLTPPTLLRALGQFDLDPCAAPAPRPWDTAARHYDFSVGQDGLALPWEGSVFCNPPYGTETGTWLAKCAAHGDAVALIFARTETRAFVKEVWEKASAVFFLAGRIKFCRPNGTPGASAAAPSVLVAYGADARRRLFLFSLPGQFLENWDRHDDRDPLA